LQHCFLKVSNLLLQVMVADPLLPKCGEKLSATASRQVTCSNDSFADFTFRDRYPLFHFNRCCRDWFNNFELYRANIQAITDGKRRFRKRLAVQPCIARPAAHRQTFRRVDDQTMQRLYPRLLDSHIAAGARADCRLAGRQLD
jgi:hypothetical protein